MNEQQTQEQIQKQCERFLASCPVALCLASLSDGRILKLNERFLILSGCEGRTVEEIGSLSLQLWTESHSTEKLRSRLREIQVLRNQPAEFSIDPSVPSQRAIASLSLVQFGDQECMLVFLEEFSKSKKVERALATARDSALESARLKSEFLANVSHEIRTPLNGVIGMTCLLLDTKLSSLQRNFTETIRISADNLLNLINEILDFSKLEAGKLVVEQAPFDLLGMIENTLDVIAERAQSKKLELTYLVDPTVPTKLIGDAGRCRQVLTNLIGNAIKFTSEGEVSLRISSDAESARIRFEIRDTGIGIPKDALPNLFEAFHQVDSSSTRRFEGTGLGLAISRQLVDVMGGTIGVESTPESGSCFWFTIPLVEQQTPATPPVVAEKLRSARILLVEQNQTNAGHLLAFLHHHGIATDHVTTGQDALKALRQGAQSGRPYNVTMLDILTPDLDGLAVARAIKAEQSIAGTSILILTTVTHQLETNLLHASNIGACLTKPLKQSRLLDYLHAAMSETLDKRPATAMLPELSESDAAESATTKSTPLRILIAEDNSINQKVAQGLLGRLGFSSDVVADGRSLLQALDQSPRDVVFMDCQLPEMDGLKATIELRNRERSANNGHRTYVIAMTADAIPGARERCLTAGMDDYLSKPIRLDELQAVIRRAAEFVALSARNGHHRHPMGYIDASVMETLRMLRTPGQPDPLPLLIDEFVCAAQNRLEELQSAMIHRDTCVIESASHNLRGSAAGIGALRLADLSGEMEEGVRSGSFKESAAILSQMDQEFLLVKNALEVEKSR